MKRSRYEELAVKWRNLLLAEASKPEKDQNWPEEWLRVTATSTCRTPGCRLQGIGNEVHLAENADGVYRCICCACGNPIWDLVASFDDGDVLLNTGV